MVHRSAFGLPDLLIEMHPCGLHVCYPKKMGKFGFFQTVEDNMKLFSKRQIAGAVRARDLFENLIYPSTSDFRAIVSVGGVSGSDVTNSELFGNAEGLYTNGLLCGWDWGTRGSERAEEACHSNSTGRQVES